MTNLERVMAQIEALLQENGLAGVVALADEGGYIDRYFLASAIWTGIVVDDEQQEVCILPEYEQGAVRVLQMLVETGREATRAAYNVATMLRCQQHAGGYAES